MSFLMFDLVLLKDVAAKTGLVILALVIVYIFFQAALQLLDLSGYGKEEEKKGRKP